MSVRYLNIILSVFIIVFVFIGKTWTEWVFIGVPVLAVIMLFINAGTGFNCSCGPSNTARTVRARPTRKVKVKIKAKPKRR